MSHALKNNSADNRAWQPNASIQQLKKRAHLIALIRDFFAKRDVWEVETPLLAHTSVTDPFIQSIAARPYREGPTFYLQTSPEYAMKRLLAAGSGSIYQISKAFRQEETGHLHNPEFTILEWYRVGFDHHQLMDEMDELLQCLLKTGAAKRYSYQSLFETFLKINPHTASLETLQTVALAHQIIYQAKADRDTWLQLLLTHLIEPKLGFDVPCFVYDFPESQAALARVREETPPLASRFEVYVKGIELANGFHELNEVNELRKRFDQNLTIRKTLNLPLLPIDEHLLNALPHLPDCAGVALGIDRLIMLALDCKAISDVLSFDIYRA